MVKVEVIEQFTLKKFDELKNLVRAKDDVKGSLFVGDTFECTKEMTDYLTGKNPLNKPFVKVIEVIPEEVKTEVEKPEEIKPKTTKKPTTRKKK